MTAKPKQRTSKMITLETLREENERSGTSHEINDIIADWLKNRCDLTNEELLKEVNEQMEQNFVTVSPSNVDERVSFFMTNPEALDTYVEESKKHAADNVIVWNDLTPEEQQRLRKEMLDFLNQ